MHSLAKFSVRGGCFVRIFVLSPVEDLSRVLEAPFDYVFISHNIQLSVPQPHPQEYNVGSAATSGNEEFEKNHVSWGQQGFGRVFGE